MDKTKCKYMVPDPPYYIRRYQCSRNVKVNGYCTQHWRMVKKRKAEDNES